MYEVVEFTAGRIHPSGWGYDIEENYSSFPTYKEARACVDEILVSHDILRHDVYSTASADNNYCIEHWQLDQYYEASYGDLLDVEIRNRKE